MTYLINHLTAMRDMMVEDDEDNDEDLEEGDKWVWNQLLQLVKNEL